MTTHQGTREHGTGGPPWPADLVVAAVTPTPSERTDERTEERSSEVGLRHRAPLSRRPAGARTPPNARPLETTSGEQQFAGNQMRRTTRRDEDGIAGAATRATKVDFATGLGVCGATTSSAPVNTRDGPVEAVCASAQHSLSVAPRPAFFEAQPTCPLAGAASRQAQAEMAPRVPTMPRASRTAPQAWATGFIRSPLLHEACPTSRPTYARFALRTRKSFASCAAATHTLRQPERCLSRDLPTWEQRSSSARRHRPALSCASLSLRRATSLSRSASRQPSLASSRRGSQAAHGLNPCGFRFLLHGRRRNEGGDVHRTDPAKVLVSARATVTAGFAKDVDAVNQ